MKSFTKTIQLTITMLMTVYSVSPYAMEKENNKLTKQNWDYVAYLDDDPIGYHNFKVIKDKDQIIVITKAEFDVRFMFIPVYSYEHTNTEIWRDGCLISMESRTDDDGDIEFVNLTKKQDVTHIKTQKKNISDSSCVKSFAYWDPKLIRSNRLLNSQTGELIDVTYNYVGENRIKVNNKFVYARHYELTGEDNEGNDIHISLWYNFENRWLALESRLENGRYLRYRLQDGSVQ